MSVKIEWQGDKRDLSDEDIDLYIEHAKKMFSVEGDLVKPAHSDDDGCPAWCFVMNEVDSTMVIVINGTEGYEMFPSVSCAHGDVNEANRRIGVTEAQQRAMLVGSMFGWHAPAASPAHFYGTGKVFAALQAITFEHARLGTHGMEMEADPLDFINAVRALIPDTLYEQVSNVVWGDSQ